MVIKELSYKVHHLQARRIRCEHCGEPFTCLVEGEFKVATSGIPIVNSDEAMHKALAKQAGKRLRAVDGKFGREVGLCPGCRRYQPWMIRRSRWTSFSVQVGGALAAMFLAFGIFCAVFISGSGTVGNCIVLASISAGAGIGISWLRALPGGVQKKRKDPGAVPDADMNRLFAHCRETEREPLVEWYLSIHDSPPKDRVLVSLGCRDLIGEEFFPPEFGSEAVLEQLGDGE